MAAADSPIALAGEFPSVARDVWEALAGDIDALRSTSYDGITIEPLYTSADESAPAGLPDSSPFTRGHTAAGTHAGRWDVRQVVDGAAGAGRALEELERGATSIWLELRHVSTVDHAAIAAALDGVLLDLAPVVLAAGRRWPEAALGLAALWDAAPSAGGSLGADPFGAWASDRAGRDLEVELSTAAEWATRLASSAPGVRTVTVDGSRYHDAGSSDAQELGFMLAAAVATLTTLADGGVADPFGGIELRVVATADQFATIAKFRAARRLWARVAEIVGDEGAAAATTLHAVMSTAMMTRYDPAVNMLRGTVACFSAGIAGADAVTVLPYDAFSAERPSELGRRLARNTQSVLAMESHLTRVIDPAGGSWYVERLTSELANAAWDVFQEVELAGGFRSAVEAGVVNERIAEVRHRRRADVDCRRAPITGLTEFPNIGEVPPAAVDGHIEQAIDGSLARHRWAEDFEALRQRVDAIAAQGSRPCVLLATLGPPAVFASRAMFAKNLFEIAGIETRFGPVTSDVAEIIEAFASAPSRVVCICSNDAAYADDGAALAKALTAAGASRVYLAGEPPEVIDELTAAGVTHTVTAGDDARATLADLLDHLDIP